MKLYSHYIKIKNIKIKSIAVLAVCSLFFSMGSGALTSFAHTPDESRFLNGTWEKDDHGWWFANKGNPDYFTSTWPNIRDTPTILVPMAIWSPVGII